ncbi:MAG: hypothetical protein MI742_06240 [Desulfobacterales bacterium]|nr:hypothetical protein [Desulfobacterales bacterium]
MADRMVIWALALWMLLLSGCAVRQPAAVFLKTSAKSVPEEGAWWQCRLRPSWDRHSPAEMSVDLLLASEVAAPLLKAYAKEIHLWRFHRRAAPDAAGHQFSFMFYSSSRVAEEIFSQVKEDPLIQEMLSAGLLETVVCDDPEKPTRRSLGATSDAAWPEIIQRHWPIYIMGVSAFWLKLGQELAGPAPEGEILSEKMIRYMEAHHELTLLWRREGQHALLHHLNAIFGYEKMWIKMPLRF